MRWFKSSISRTSADAAKAKQRLVLDALDLLELEVLGVYQVERTLRKSEPDDTLRGGEGREGESEFACGGCQKGRGMVVGLKARKALCLCSSERAHLIGLETDDARVVEGGHDGGVVSRPPWPGDGLA